jgi:hypothetical protein
MATRTKADRRIAANYEFYKHKFVGKSDQELREWAIAGFDGTTNIHLSEFTKTMMVNIAFAIEEELTQRGVGGVYA